MGDGHLAEHRNQGKLLGRGNTGRSKDKQMSSETTGGKHTVVKHTNLWLSKFEKSRSMEGSRLG